MESRKQEKRRGPRGSAGKHGSSGNGETFGNRRSGRDGTAGIKKVFFRHSCLTQGFQNARRVTQAVDGIVHGCGRQADALGKRALGQPGIIQGLLNEAFNAGALMSVSPIGAHARSFVKQSQALQHQGLRAARRADRLGVSMDLSMSDRSIL